MIRTKVAAIGLATLISVAFVGSPVSAAKAERGRRSILTVPVSFTVQNVDRSLVGCFSDQATYEIRGHLIAPASALRRRGGSLTLYLHGFGFGEYFWNFTSRTGYEYAARQAAAGRTSVIIDRLGYGRSGTPQGDLTCIGAQADIAHQIVGQLRTGRYRAALRPAPAFGRVALVGHSMGGQIAEVEAASFRDVDALIVVAYADFGASQLAVQMAVVGSGQVCAQGGQKAHGTYGPTGYAFLGQTAQEYDGAMFFNADPAVVERAIPLRGRDPCGDYGSAVPPNAVDEVGARTINVPVLLVYGDHDLLFPASAGQRQRSMYTGSSDVTLVTLANTGHAVTLGRTAERFRSVMLRWLSAHRL